MIILAIKVKGPKKKIIIANLIAIPLVIAISEGTCGLLNLQNALNTETHTTIPYMTPQISKYLGYTPIANSVFLVTATQHKKIIYQNAIYTINKDGLRYTPSSNEKSNQCLLFFGDSFTFGEGLNDDETLPYLVGKKTHHKYKIYNFAYSGYGPQQMLSAIEHGIVDKKIKNCKSTTAIYSGLPDHAKRIAGKLPWQKYDPKYSLVNNEAVYKGSFNGKKVGNSHPINPWLMKAQTIVFVHNKIVEQKTVVKESEEAQYEKLYIAILKKTKKLLKQKYNADFIILLWDFGDSEDFQNYAFQRTLRENSFDYYLMSSILPNYSYTYLRQDDGHPKTLANEFIADFISKKLSRMEKSYVMIK